MFKTIQATIERDKDYPARQYRLDVLSRVLNGTFYDGMTYEFHQEEIEGTGEYVPLRSRRPSVRYALCRTVVEDSVSLLFSEGHFPAIQTESEKTREALLDIVKETMLNATMIDAATKGSVGSVCLFLRVIRARVFITAEETQFLTPTWDPEAPDTLKKVTERYKVKGHLLKDGGYAVPDDKLEAQFWFQRDWTDTQEVWYEPVEAAPDAPPPTIDSPRTVTHSLGFVPCVWVRNLPGGDRTDGACTFPVEAIDCQIEIDYQLSQAGRGLKYSSDPTLMLKEPAAPNDSRIVKGAGSALVVGEKGDAKLLEINGTAVAAVLDYVRGLRELALESAHGNRANADKLNAAQSGRAMELMNQALIWLADKLRISYGEGALLDLLRMIVAASQKYPLKLKDGTDIGTLDMRAALSLRWPAWYAPTYADKLSQAETLSTARAAGVLSQETAVKAIATDYDIEDVAKEITAINADALPPSLQPPPSNTTEPAPAADD
ncbi:hypothetical protein [Variovorax sp. GB1P17]|uniref:hypothetical protein n=1 Tax=Variovorax sp. GB1P17 TaxID=3443740 RepID=UPI003F44AEE7